MDDIVQKLRLLSRKINNVDLESAKWRTETDKILNDVVEAVERQHASITNILNVLIEHERAIATLLNTKNASDTLSLPPINKSVKKDN